MSGEKVGEETLHNLRCVRVDVKDGEDYAELALRWLDVLRGDNPKDDLLEDVEQLTRNIRASMESALRNLRKAISALEE